MSTTRSTSKWFGCIIIHTNPYKVGSLFERFDNIMRTAQIRDI